ncbi:hypothetical protein M0657_008749 [Pyricularia oryzae]|uniref:Uncharacterized protein n=1 Tax=Pyricularia oryzae (strain Y34) TaxID=1143189 RepID=A0AA97PHQ1_PYRO3|nr:hypothetical protein OOU_Y34scaffold00731g1 [Pyricularia oryzae Y34]KAI7916115.1 hypothetical protein M0657_008749 [Pyricularia oryzae]
MANNHAGAAKMGTFHLPPPAAWAVLSQVYIFGKNIQQSEAAEPCRLEDDWLDRWVCSFEQPLRLTSATAGT